MTSKLFALILGTSLSLPALAIGGSTAHAASSDDTNLMLIFDASGSMKRKLDSGETRLATAKKAMSDVLQNAEEGMNLGLTMYGHRVKKQCTDIELVAPIGSEDPAAINAMIQNVEAKGETPIAESIRHAVKSFKAFKEADNRIVLVTDGIEECGGNVCEAAQFAKDAGVDLKIDVVGFTLNEEQRASISCIADITGGKYYDAADAGSLTASMKKAVKKSSDDVEDEGAANTSGSINLLAASNGANLEVAPNKDWSRLTDGSEEISYFESIGKGMNALAIYSFPGGKSVTFDRFEWLVDSTDAFNLATAEILVGDSPKAETLRSVGICEFQNTLMIRSPYQACSLPQTTAKYVAVRLMHTYDSQNRVRNAEMRLFGSLEGGNPSTVADNAGPSANQAVPSKQLAIIEKPTAANGKLVDICETWGVNCGASVAQSICKEKGYTAAFWWTEVKNMGDTYVIRDDKVCSGPDCTAFGKLACLP